MATPMTAAALRARLATLPDDSALYDDVTGLAILDVHVDPDGALTLVLDSPPPSRVVNTFTGTGEFSGVLIQTGSTRGGTIRF